MNEIHIVPIPELPRELTSAAHVAIRSYAVSMIATSNDESDAKTCSGTFVTLNGRSGILTARHVWEKTRKYSKLILMIGGAPYRVERRFLDAEIVPATTSLEPFRADVPDLAFVPLATDMQGTIQARGKVFYSLDRRRGAADFDLYGDDGLWVVVGSPNALLREVDGAVGSLIYDTGIEKRFKEGGWDYVLVNMNVEGNPEIPSDFGGMSGGGLWRVKFRMDANRSSFWIEDASRDVILSGVIFYQTPSPGRQLIAHGPESIYDLLHK